MSIVEQIINWTPDIDIFENYYEYEGMQYSYCISGVEIGYTKMFWSNPHDVICKVIMQLTDALSKTDEGDDIHSTLSIMWDNKPYIMNIVVSRKINKRKKNTNVSK